MFGDLGALRVKVIRQGHQIVESECRQLAMTWHKKIDGDLTGSFPGKIEQ